MEMIHNGIEVDNLPETAHCRADIYQRNPMELEECPCGERKCDGDCYYYSEERKITWKN